MMNKTIKAIVVTCVVLLMAGCEVGEGELMKTKTGHLMYQGWCQDVGGLLTDLVEPVFNLYAWTQAPADQKDEIFNRYFYTNTEILTTSNHTWEMRINDRTSMRVALEYGTPFSEPGGKMRFVYSTFHEPEPLKNILFILENKGNGVWEVYSDDGNIDLELTFGVQTIPESLAETLVSIEGQGYFTHKSTFLNLDDYSYDHEEYTFLHYDIRQPFECVWNTTSTNSTWHGYTFGWMRKGLAFTSGKVHLQALDEEGQGNTADITVLNPEEIEIEMDGIVQRRKL